MYKLTELDHWVNWKGKNKKPIGSINKVRLTFEQAIQNMLTGNADGIGFILTKDDPYVVIDLDKCIETGHLVTKVTQILEKFKNTYQELSPSATGVHIWCKGTLPKAGYRKGKVEIYASKRYMTVTLNPINNTTIIDCQEAIDWLLKLYGMA